MAEYIEREAVLKFIEDGLNNPDRAKAFGYDAVCIMGEVRFMDAADVVEVVHGRWEFIGDDYANCTNCGTIFETRPTPYFFSRNNKFCRSCGARMDGDTND